MKLLTNGPEHITLKKAIDTYGVKSQEDVAIEEMSELTKAIIKNRRYNTDETRLNIAEELADVLIMLTQLCFVYGYCDNYCVSDFIDDKIDRLKKRLDEKDEKEEEKVQPTTNFDLIKTASRENLAKILLDILYSSPCFTNLFPPDLIKIIKQEEIKEVEKFLGKVVEPDE